ncbi:SAM-dependent methyltransferase [Streptomyces spectabilis]|uniref:Class I SAM-dependent methyltransferase n=1 Tax=Streptomyces spectabilis TaxID=68270 RepID=A0A5P2X580_STRST|nr:class I SAM-dependent methyltransferase [Streptomyces spectabilis]MBB5103028.1 cyclopropane fatty-acyl-phospholipid synthase-like methyltransferase [Streptomyces spectabilis]MCI3902223.1 class I SAM-dependent methyltransferase [Streptomyces spectabilis]QEV59598.1 class I SAM-dependent methyltransferase [Streptomyces spectabilis]GGV15212.1 SAM-dependent methyltransferase [Streptomyces spectabilis]
MTSTDAPPRLTRLAFHGPLSEARAARIVARAAESLTAAERPTVLDLGCGWGELTLRLLEAVPGATAVGVDLHEEDLARGRALARARGLADRVEFVAESATDTARGPADVVLCLSSAHALLPAGAEPPYAADALRALRRLVRPGGRVVLGEGFWQRTPTAAELAGMWPDARADEHLHLGGLVDAAVAAGFRPMWVETASAEEWEEFESAYLADVEVWLAANAAHPRAAAARERADRHRAAWLRGYRSVLGTAYLTLVPVG